MPAYYVQNTKTVCKENMEYPFMILLQNVTMGTMYLKTKSYI